MKIKGQGTLTKWITNKIAKKNKQDFAKIIEYNIQSLLNQIFNDRIVDFSVVSFSSANDFPEQILSILSFLNYVGFPRNWTLYSDGTHTKEQLQLIQSNLPFIKVIFTDLSIENEMHFSLKASLLGYKKELLDYARKKPLGKKLLFYLNHLIKDSTLFLDSDILFYHKANELPNTLAGSLPGWFLPDCKEGGNLNQSYSEQQSFQAYQVNSGIIAMNGELQYLDTGLKLLTQANGTYDYFTEQTILHIILQANQYFPFDPRLYVVDTSDQFRYSYISDRNSIAARHFTGPVRHKMWQRSWKWQLQINY